MVFRPRMFTRFLKAWLPVIAMCVAIFLFSQDSSSGQHSDSLLAWLLSLAGMNTAHLRHVLDEPFRKFAHVVVYYLLGTLTYRGFALGRKYFDPPAAVRALLFCAAYAASDEYHQTFVPTRGPSVHDVMLDTAAATLALLVIWLFRHQRSEPPAFALPQMSK